MIPARSSTIHSKGSGRRYYLRSLTVAALSGSTSSPPFGEGGCQRFFHIDDLSLPIATAFGKSSVVSSARESRRNARGGTCKPRSRVRIPIRGAWDRPYRRSWGFRFSASSAARPAAGIFCREGRAERDPQETLANIVEAFKEAIARCKEQSVDIPWTKTPVELEQEAVTRWVILRLRATERPVARRRGGRSRALSTADQCRHGNRPRHVRGARPTRSAAVSLVPRPTLQTLFAPVLFRSLNAILDVLDRHERTAPCVVSRS